MLIAGDDGLTKVVGFPGGTKKEGGRRGSWSSPPSTEWRIIGAVRFHFKEFDFDDEERRLFRSGEPLHLTAKAFELLRLLIAARPRALTKFELREKLWPDVVVDEANLKNLVVEIRSALGESGRGVIRTVHRYGYAFSDDFSETPRPMPRLIYGEHVCELHAGENRIGRSSGCIAVVHSSGVSRQHAVIHIEGDVAILDDLQSKNGTWRNEARVQGPVTLRDGDAIRIGASTLIFRSSAAGDTTTLSEHAPSPV